MSCLTIFSIITASTAGGFSIVFIIVSGIFQLWPTLLLSFFCLAISIPYFILAVKYKKLHNEGVFIPHTMQMPSPHHKDRTYQGNFKPKRQGVAPTDTDLERDGFL